MNVSRYRVEMQQAIYEIITIWYLCKNDNN